MGRERRMGEQITETEAACVAPRCPITYLGGDSAWTESQQEDWASLADSHPDAFSRGASCEPWLPRAHAPAVFTVTASTHQQNC